MAEDKSNQNVFYKKRFFWEVCNHWYTFTQILVFSWVCVPQNPVLMLALLALFQCFSLPATRLQMRQDWKTCYIFYFPWLRNWFARKKTDHKLRSMLLALLFICLCACVMVYASIIFLNAVGGFHALLVPITSLRWITWPLSFLALVPGLIFSVMNTGADALMYLAHPLMTGNLLEQFGSIKTYCLEHPYLAVFKAILAVGLAYLSLQIAGNIGLMWVTGAQKTLMASGLWGGATATAPRGLMVFMRVILAFDFMKRMMGLLGIERESIFVTTFCSVKAIGNANRFKSLFIAASALVMLFRSLMSIKTLTVLGGVSRLGFSGVAVSVVLKEIEQCCRGVVYVADYAVPSSDEAAVAPAMH